jgi:hypothetical protein
MIEYNSEQLINKYINIGLNKEQAIKAALIDINNTKSLEKKLLPCNNPISIAIFDELFLIKKDLENILHNNF